MACFTNQYKEIYKNKKYKIWVLPQKCFKAATKTKILHVTQANNYMVLSARHNRGSGKGNSSS